MAILELNDIEKENREFLDQFSKETIYSKEDNCKKIDLFSNGNYVGSTNSSKTLKLAKARLLARHWLTTGCTRITAKRAK